MIGALAKIDSSCDYTQVVCLGITRELVRPIVPDAVIPFSKYISPPITYDLIVQEFRAPERSVIDKCNKHLVIGTPGRISSLLSSSRGYLSFRRVHTFILDEADTFITKKAGDMGDEVDIYKGGKTI